MIGITGEQYYQDHIAQEKEYVRIFAAYPIAKGEALNDGSNKSAPEDGYEIGYDFYTTAEFAAQTKPAGDLALPAPKQNLPLEQLAKLIPVNKGEDMMAADPQTGLELEQTADHDGFLIPYGDVKAYMSNFEFSACFNDAVQQNHSEAAPVAITFNDESTPVKAILLTETVSLAMHGKEYVAAAGSILRNEGRTISTIFNQNYRLTDIKPEIIAHQDALDNQDALRKIWQKKKSLKGASA